MLVAPGFSLHHDAEASRRDDEARTLEVVDGTVCVQTMASGRKLRIAPGHDLHRMVAKL